jgi:hypothetical protein
MAGNGTMMGLLRSFSIDWQLRARTGGTNDPLLFRFTTEAGKNLVLQADPRDPKWAAYAVILYAEYSDFAALAFNEAGWTTPARPDSFSFSQASGQNW